MCLLYVTIIPRCELAYQHCLPRRSFLLLTTTGMYTIEKLRPIDIFAQYLLTGNFELDDFIRFIRDYGEDQCCAMCLILVKDPSKVLPRL